MFLGILGGMGGPLLCEFESLKSCALDVMEMDGRIDVGRASHDHEVEAGILGQRYSPAPVQGREHKLVFGKPVRVVPCIYINVARDHQSIMNKKTNYT